MAWLEVSKPLKPWTPRLSIQRKFLKHVEQDSSFFLTEISAARKAQGLISSLTRWHFTALQAPAQSPFQRRQWPPCRPDQACEARRCPG